jgi:hypothetical protein
LLCGLAGRNLTCDVWQLFIAPVVVGVGNKALPDNVRLDLELQDEGRFGSGVMHLRYRTRAL